MDLTAVAETHLELLRMSVDVDELRVEREVENVGSVPATVQDVAIGDAYRVHQQSIADVAIVDEPELLIRLATRGRRQTDPTRDVDGSG